MVCHLERTQYFTGHAKSNICKNFNFEEASRKLEESAEILRRIMSILKLKQLDNLVPDSCDKILNLEKKEGSTYCEKMLPQIL